MGRLTTHVLDTAQGKPAVGMQVELWKLDTPGERILLRDVYTNVDGRVDGALLEGEAFGAGSYELVFLVGAYFAGQHVHSSNPPFLDRVPVRFTISAADAHYHIPLLVSPWAYSTYRGS